MTTADNTVATDPDDVLPDREPKSARAWLAAITHAEKEYRSYQEKADNIDRQFASLERLASNTRDREFQIFWANIQVLAPSIYARPPVPVVVPRFQDRRPLQRTTSELLERSTSVGFQLADIDSVMRLIRDDVVIAARGVAWIRYETKSESDTDNERICIEHVDRRDFLHTPARYWSEVDWVAKRSWLSKAAMRKRFRKHSGDIYQRAAYAVQKEDDGTNDNVQKAAVWEIWCRSQNRVVWVSEGCDKLLDDGEPHLTLESFWPCPRPAYATLQRRTLVPVPDMVFYKDQLEEINELTARIGSLADAVRLRGFYPGGNGEISDAIEKAIRSTGNGMELIPISNWALLGGGSAKDSIVWLPLEMIVKSITELVAIRRELIDDVYQITGLSDIMRGSTEASETLGAQQLKSQYGSIRIRDRQDELVRIARDAVRIAAEIMAENFSGKTLLSMSQMQLRTDAEVKREAAEIQSVVQAITAQLQDPEAQAMAQANPEQAQPIIQQAQAQVQQAQGRLQELEQEVTIDACMKLLRDERVRPFALDIETDSTIAPDENAQKQRATEYTQSMAAILAQAVPAVQALPQIAPLVADTLKFMQGQYRVGRQMDQTVDEFVEAMKGLAGQPKPDPEAAKAEGEAKAAQAKAESDAKSVAAEAALKQADAQQRTMELQEKARQAEADGQMRMLELRERTREAELKLAHSQEQHKQAMDKGSLELQRLAAEIEHKRQQTDERRVDAAAKQQAETATVEML